MTGPSWLIDSKRIASKIKNASEQVDPSKHKWISNPTKACPRCNHTIDNSDVVHEWPGLPKGVKFDPSDQELLWHLVAKIGKEDAKPHPFINEFIPTVEKDEGICYTHPQRLPGVKQDGSVSHFFHRTFKAYNTGTRKRRKINSDDLGDVRWHKTGKTKSVIIDGKHAGCKKIMVLYMSTVKGEKPEKTNWVMHQYHLGTEEDEKDGEYVVSKLFYQQQPKPGEKSAQDLIASRTLEPAVVGVDPVDSDFALLPKDLVENQVAICSAEIHPAKVETVSDETMDGEYIHQEPEQPDDEVATKINPVDSALLPEDLVENQGVLYSPKIHLAKAETIFGETTDGEYIHPKLEQTDNQDNHPVEDTKWWEGESQFILDSQQLAEGIAVCEEFLQSQTSCDSDEPKKDRPRISDYAHMAVEDLKKDLEECQKLESLGHADIEFDTPPDFRLSQLEFGSQDSFLAWGGSKIAD